MREIKYRYILECVIEWGTYKIGDQDMFYMSLESLERLPIDNQWKVVKRFEFTGLKDKKREVYESDLYELRVNGIETHVEIIDCEVKWSDKGCGFGFFRLTKDSEQPQWIGMNDKNIIGKKYLGNIHELEENEGKNN